MKELREKYVFGKGPLMLHKVEEVHAVCGLLKDFLRKLSEPLVTFKLHRTFMEASGKFLFCSVCLNYSASRKYA